MKKHGCPQHRVFFIRKNLERTLPKTRPQITHHKPLIINTLSLIKSRNNQKNRFHKVGREIRQTLQW
jgi:hypothetical protein